MKERSSMKFKILYIFIFTALVLSGCTGEGLEKLWLKSEGWSRGVLIGETAMASPMEPVIDPEGNVFSVIFPRSDLEDGLYQPVLVILSPDAQSISKIPLDFQIRQPRKAKLIQTDEGFDFFWIESNQLKGINLNEEGESLSEIMILSTEERVEHLEVIEAEEGYEIWYSGSKETPGVFALRGELGELEKSVIDAEGIRINLFKDAKGQIHASWARYPISYGDIEFYYQQPSDSDSDASQPILVYTSGITPAVKVDGPVLGIDSEVGYFIWTTTIISGLEAGDRRTSYRYFPVGEPENIRPTMAFRVPLVANLPTSEFQGGTFETGERVYVYGGIPSSSALENIEIIAGQYDELAFVFRSRSEFKWRDFRNQANVAFLSDGLITTYQPLSYTSAESYYPSVVADQDLNLYVTWLEKGETTYRAYLTTTDPLKKEQLDLVTTDDYLYLTAEGVFGFLAGSVLAPFAAAAWGGIGLVGFIFNMIFSQFNRSVYRTIGEILSMITGIGVFWFMKLATLPGLKTWDYVPFSAWIPRIPDTLTQPLIYGVPALIGVIALAVAYFNTYGKKAGSAINFHLLYCAVDTLLSCAVYGILIYGSF